MPPIKGIVICVGYDDLLALTLPINARHLTDIVVVTTATDAKTHAVVKEIPNARCFTTDAFTRHGAKFNKGAAVEEGFDALGRDGWILIWDADTILPDSMDLDNLDPARLYGAKRRMLIDPKQYSLSLDWKKLPLCPQGGFPGYFQLFHGACPQIKSLPWYDTTYEHAGMGDNYFQQRWPAPAKTWLPFEVLHLGPKDKNWYGRVTERLDGEAIPEANDRAANMARMMRGKGWGGNPRPKLPFAEKIAVSMPKVPTVPIKDGPDLLHVPQASNTWADFPTTNAEMRWVSVNRLVRDAVTLAGKLPSNVAGIAGVPRSGMIPASTIATFLQVPLYELSEAGKMTRLGHGSRCRTPGFGAGGGPIVVVEDVVYTGESIKKVRAAAKGNSLLFSAVYVRPEAAATVDLFAVKLPSPFLLEWHIANGSPFVGAARNPVFGDGIACDFDGIICHDDLSGGVEGTPYLIPRRNPCKLIATGRRESHRPAVEKWLKTHGVKCLRLEMLSNDSDGSSSSIAAHKAKHLLSTKLGFFMESCPKQAEEIAELSGRPVICPAVEKVFHGIE